MNKIELIFKDSIRSFFFQWLNDDINKSAGFHFSILDHFKVTSPNQSSAQDIMDVVQIFLEICQWNFINDVFGKGMVFKVEQNSLIIVQAIVESDVLCLRFNEGFNYINCFILLEKTDFDTMRTKSWMFFGVGSLLDADFCFFRFWSWVPWGFDLIQWWFFQPELSPLIQRELLYIIVLFHFSDKINQSGIRPFVFFEIVW